MNGTGFYNFIGMSLVSKYFSLSVQLNYVKNSVTLETLEEEINNFERKSKKYNRCVNLVKDLKTNLSKTKKTLSSKLNKEEVVKK
jgi:predicted  nucleic acid-binding Zn-ribbon protein